MKTYTDEQIIKIRKALVASINVPCYGGHPYQEEALAELDKPVVMEPVAIVIQCDEVDLEGTLTHLRDIDYYQDHVDLLPVGVNLYAVQQGEAK